LVIVALGFAFSAVFIPLLGIFAFARIQGSITDFAKKSGRIFSVLYGVLLYFIAVTLPIPRTASVTHEIAIQPFFNTSALVTSIIYFFLVFIMLLNRSKIADILGKYLTPFILIIVFAIIIFGFFVSPHYNIQNLKYFNFTGGVIEGYQTFDALGAVVGGSVIVLSLKLKGFKTPSSLNTILTKAGIIAAIGLFSIYMGLIFVGAKMGADFNTSISRSELLLDLTHKLLGNTGKLLLSILVSFACFTTAVGVLAGAADFFKSLFDDSEKAYKISAFIVCVIGIVFGQLPVSYIIAIAYPVLLFIYPITIVMIVMHVLPQKWTDVRVFKAVVLASFLFSLPDVMTHIPFLKGDYLETINNIIPLAEDGFASVIPAILTFILLNLFKTQSAKTV